MNKSPGKKPLAATILLGLFITSGATADLTSKELLGKALFFDKNLSTPVGQSCAVCHGAEAGWTGPDSMINAHGAVYEGAVIGRFGNRKPPSSGYATQSPILHFSRSGGGTFTGGNFWDGRATGEKLGNPAADQAQGPFLNPLEQNNDSPQVVCDKVSTSSFAQELTGYTYVMLFDQAFGAGSLDCTAAVDATYDRIALAIAAYEGSREVNSFSSKYDAFLARKTGLTAEELKGLALFNGRGKCFRCHTSAARPMGAAPLFTDYTYDNLGVPRNPENPFYTQLEFNPLGSDWIDLGLGEFLASRIDYQRYAPANLGKQKVPTLRNVDKRPSPEFVKAYGHNGYFKSLKGIVHFYNTRDVKPRCPNLFTTEADALAQGCWPAPEVTINVNTTELGDLRLSDAEENAIVTFLKTLSDGFGQ